MYLLVIINSLEKVSDEKQGINLAWPNNIIIMANDTLFQSFYSSGIFLSRHHTDNRTRKNFQIFLPITQTQRNCIFLWRDLPCPDWLADHRNAD